MHGHEEKNSIFYSYWIFSVVRDNMHYYIVYNVSYLKCDFVTNCTVPETLYFWHTNGERTQSKRKWTVSSERFVNGTQTRVNVNGERKMNDLFGKLRGYRPTPISTDWNFRTVLLWTFARLFAFNLTHQNLVEHWPKKNQTEILTMNEL